VQMLKTGHGFSSSACTLMSIAAASVESDRNEPATEAKRQFTPESLLRVESGPNVLVNDPIAPRPTDTPTTVHGVVTLGNCSQIWVTASQTNHPHVIANEKGLDEEPIYVCRIPKQASPYRGSLNAHPVKIEFEKDDPLDPFNWSASKKWLITIVGCAYTGFVCQSQPKLFLHCFALTQSSQVLRRRRTPSVIRA
jgi:hypothetical protein